MLALDPNQELSLGWMRRFQKLNESDICGPGRRSDNKSEGQFVPSWIWLVPHSSSSLPASTSPNDLAIVASSTPDSNGHTPVDDAEVANSMRVHWAKCQAQAERYEEEVVLTIEEMCRTLRYFEWKKAQWLSLRSEQAESDTPPLVDIQCGLNTYASLGVEGVLPRG